MSNKTHEKTEVETHWGTADEIKFIDGLGGWIGSDHILANEDKKQRKIRLLNKYLDACAVRTKWDSVRSAVIIRYVENLLEELEDEASA